MAEEILDLNFLAGYNVTVTAPVENSNFRYSGSVRSAQSQDDFENDKVRAGDIASQYPDLATQSFYNEDDYLHPRLFWLFLPDSTRWVLSYGVKQVNRTLERSGQVSLITPDGTDTKPSTTTPIENDFGYEYVCDNLFACYHINYGYILDWYGQEFSPNPPFDRLSSHLRGVPTLRADNPSEIYEYLKTGKYTPPDEEDEEDEDDGSQDGEDGNPANPDDNTANTRPTGAFAPAIAVRCGNNSYVANLVGAESFVNWFWTSMTSEIQADDFYKYIFNAYGDLRKNIVSIRRYPFNLPREDEVINATLGRFKTSLQYNPLKIGKGGTWNRVVTYSAKVPNQWNNFVDYKYMNVYAFLPWYGTITLPAPEVVGRTVNFDYFIDFTTGGCDIYICVENQVINRVTTNLGANVMYELDSGFSASQIVANNAINIGKTFASSAIPTVGGLAGKGKVGNAISGGTGMIGSAVGNVPDLKTTQDSLTGNPPMNDNISCSSDKAVIYYSYPKYSKVKDSQFNNIYGYMCDKDFKLENLKTQGFTVCASPRIKFNEPTEPAPTDGEVRLIYEWLEKGVIL